MMKRFIAAVLFCAALSPVYAGGEDATQKVPAYENTNVILISLQCLRPDHLGAYGYKRETSRNMDELAKKSVVFENAIAQANLTPIAQMSVLTSQYPRVNGMVSFEVSRSMVSRKTLPEILKLYGYTTAAAVSSPEFFMRYDPGTGAMINPGDVFSRSFDSFNRTMRGPEGRDRRNLRRLPTEALQWIKNNKDKKFFLWIASGLLHMPYAAAVPSEFKNMYDPPDYKPFWKRLPQEAGALAADDDPSYEVFSRVYRDDFYLGFKPVHHLSAEDVKYVNARYDAGVYYTDRFIGELTELLASLNLTGKTLIILQSIHGDALGERGNYFHYDMTDTVMRNALMMRFPNERFAGKRVVEQVRGIDIMPTVLDYLDIPTPHEAQGSSMLPLLEGNPSAFPGEFAFIDRTPWWEFNLSRWYLDFESAKGDRFPPSERKKLDEYRTLLKTSFEPLDYPPGDIAVRTNEWKLILHKNRDLLDKVSWWSFITGQKQAVEEMELYDLRNDPDEIKNVAGERPEVAAKLKAKLLEWDESIMKSKATYGKDEKRLLIPYP